jgi:RNA polymerase sigma-B factor
MKRHLRDRTNVVRLPRALHEARTRLPEARQELTTRLGREPSIAELANVLGISSDDVARIETGDSTAVESAAAEDASDALETAPDRILLVGAFQALDQTDRQIIYLRFVKELSRRQTAKELGISEAALGRRTDAALARLRKELEGRPFQNAASAESRADKGADAPATPARAPAKREASHSGRLLLRMPQSLHAELAEAAEREDVSLNQYITNALAATVGWHREGGGAPESLPEPPRWLPAALVTNIVVVVIAGAVALLLLIVALQQGL